MPTIPTLEQMLEAGVHFGHRSSRWHPKMAPYLFGIRSGVHIIHLEETQKMLLPALEFVKSVAARGGTVLFVGTKSQAKDIVKKYATDAGAPSVTNRWLGGTLTNFVEIKRLIKKFLDLKDKQEKGELKKYTKKEQLWFSRDIEEMDRKVGGIQSMLTTPDAIFIVDIRTDKTALEEAKQKGVKVIALVDSNVNPNVDFPIPANDDGIKSIELMVRLIAEAVKEGKANAAEIKAAAKAEEEKEEAPKVKEEAVAVVEDLSDKIAEQVATEKTTKVAG